MATHIDGTVETVARLCLQGVNFRKAVQLALEQNDDDAEIDPSTVVDLIRCLGRSRNLRAAMQMVGASTTLRSRRISFRSATPYSDSR